MKKIVKISPKLKGMLLAAVMMTGVGITQQAQAMPVFDAANTLINTGHKVVSELNLVWDILSYDRDTAHVSNVENHNTNIENNWAKFEKHNTNIENSWTKFEEHNTNVEQHWTHLENHNTKIWDISIVNNNFYGDGDGGVTPIPYDTLAEYEAGSVGENLKDFKNATAYQNEACFGATCSKEQIAALQAEQVRSIDGQFKASQEMADGLETQRVALSGDADRLKKLNQMAMDDPKNVGQRMQMQLALQLATEQNNHLIMLRNQMLESQSAEVVRDQNAISAKGKQLQTAQNLRRPLKFDTAIASAGR